MIYLHNNSNVKEENSHSTEQTPQVAQKLKKDLTVGLKDQFDEIEYMSLSRKQRITLAIFGTVIFALGINMMNVALNGHSLLDFSIVFSSNFISGLIVASVGGCGIIYSYNGK